MAFVYAHINPKNNKVFYIGIGKHKNRCYALPNRNNGWWKIASKENFIIKILHDNVEYIIAKELERYYIEKYGRLDLGTGILTNLTAGGQGILNASEETRRKIGLAKLGSKVTPEARLKMSLSHKGIPTWNKGKKLTAEQKKNYRGMFIKGQKPWNLGIPCSEETKKKLRANPSGFKKGYTPWNKGLKLKLHA